MEREEAQLRALNQEEASLRAANERITTMAEELRKAELVRDRLEGLDRLMGRQTLRATTCGSAWRPSTWIGPLRGSTKT